MRILGMLRASKQSEAGAPPSKELIEIDGKVRRGDYQGGRVSYVPRSYGTYV
jgi:hypothetical protein